MGEEGTVRYPAEPVDADAWPDGSAVSVEGADGGDVVAVVPSDVLPAVLPDEPFDVPPVVPAPGVAVEDGGAEEESERPLVAVSVAGGPEVPADGGAEVAAAEGGTVEEGLGPAVVLVLGPGLVAGHGCGALGSSRVPEWGHRRRPRPSPATARTPPAACCAALTRRRTCTPARSRSRCLGSNAVVSRSSCINCVNCRSK
ncbi:hypothetical protein [Streptomyces sp. NPDC048277]|uniref:hypothetical protein n=1 Tax=Streptomyces sp. NPDC048277 TaxID=3155027 RepID=UPI0033CC0904